MALKPLSKDDRMTLFSFIEFAENKGFLWKIVFWSTEFTTNVTIQDVEDLWDDGTVYVEPLHGFDNSHYTMFYKLRIKQKKLTNLP